jgi:predicted DNA-binding protein
VGTLKVTIPKKLEERLDAMARRRGESKSALVREAIERLVEELDKPMKGSVFELVSDLKGIGHGPRDLSSNPKHMRGFGK